MGAKKGRIPWNKGKANCYSDETIKKMRESKIGKRVSEETKEKLRLKSTGRKHSKETKKHLSKKRKEYWNNLNDEKYKDHCKNISENHSKPLKGIKRENHPGWKGGRSYTKRNGELDGYVMVYVEDGHPSYGIKSHMLEHRYKMEKELKRRLTRNEEVHHINGIKDDNRIKNLKIVLKKIHFGKVCCPYCKKGFEVK